MQRRRFGRAYLASKGANGVCGIEWAIFGGGNLLADHQPVRLSYIHLGLNYDLMLLMAADEGLTLAITPL